MRIDGSSLFGEALPSLANENNNKSDILKGLDLQDFCFYHNQQTMAPKNQRRSAPQFRHVGHFSLTSSTSRLPEPTGAAPKKDATHHRAQQALVQVQSQAKALFVVDHLSDDLDELCAELGELTLRELNGVTPLDEGQLAKIHHLFFNTPLQAQASAFIHEPWHPVALLDRLNQAAHTAHSDDPKCKMKATGKKGEEFKGANSSYYLRGTAGQKLWVYKPCEGEAGYNGNGTVLMEGIVPGEGAVREKVAHLLNYHGYYPIPYTTLINLEGKLGSVQAFCPDCEPLLTLMAAPQEGAEGSKIDALPINKIQAISIFDILFNNGDRHEGNILYRMPIDGKETEVFAIDHGATMTASINDPLKMSYLSLVQMNEPYTAVMQELILTHNEVQKNAAIMESFQIAPNAIRWMEMASHMLKRTVELSQDLSDDLAITPKEIALLMARNKEIFWGQRENKEQLSAFLQEFIKAKAFVRGNQGYDTSDFKKFLMKELRPSLRNHRDWTVNLQNICEQIYSEL